MSATDSQSHAFQFENGATFQPAFDQAHVVTLGQSLQQKLRFITPAYNRQPIQDGFNWSEAFRGVAPGEWYLVVFRSRHKEQVDSRLLTEYDDLAYHAAVATPGYIYYFGGTPCPERYCLSFCLWANPNQARIASSHEAHRLAVGLAEIMYETFHLERYMVRNKVDGTIEFEPLQPRMS